METSHSSEVPLVTKIYLACLIIITASVAICAMIVAYNSAVIIKQISAITLTLNDFLPAEEVE